MGDHHHPREIGFHLTLTQEEREFLDTQAHRMGCSRTEAISRAPHPVDVVQGRTGQHTTFSQTQRGE